MLQKEKIKTIKKINVDVVTLDDFLRKKRKPSLVRMDVEGYEYQIIKGMMKLIASRDPLVIFIELHPHLMKKEKTSFVLKTLKENGFDIMKISKCWTRVQEITKGPPPEHSFNTMDDLINDDLLLDGKRGAFEIFFKRD